MSSETFPTSSDGTYSVGNVKVEWDRDMQEEEEVEEENVGIKEEEDTDIKEEVSSVDTV
jgi:hypothetical protein